MRHGKPIMPLFTYFTVVGALLTGLLFATDAYLPKSAPTITTSSFSGLPPAWKGEAQPQMSVSTPAPAPDMNSDAVRAASPAPIEPTRVDVAHVEAPPPAKRKKPKPQPEQDWQNHFASGWGQQQMGWGQNIGQQSRGAGETRRASRQQQNTYWR